ncbi:MAG: multidrug resistance efflux transporter family protein [Bryobacteraceae bacterium]
MSAENPPTSSKQLTQDRSGPRAVGMGIVASFFFATTFVLNRLLVTGGGHWGWAASMRYVFTFFILGTFVALKDGFGELPMEIRRHPGPWILWSAIGLGFFGLFLALAAVTGPAWLVAGGYQFTVIAGPLLAPFIYKDERRRIAPLTIVAGVIVVGGVLAMQLSRATHVSVSSAIASLGAIFMSAVLYPLGNRKLMLHLEHCRCRITASQRVFGMSTLSLIVHVPLAIFTWVTYGPPAPRELLLAAGVALSAGVIATTIFFRATEMVRNNRVNLAAVEAMQSCALLWSMLMGVGLLGEPWPQGIAAVGALAVFGGIVMFTALSALRR